MDRPLPTELKHLSLENRCRLYLMPEGLTITLNSNLNFTQWTVEISTWARSNTSQSNGQPSSLDYKARTSFMDQHVRGHQIELRCQKFKCTLFNSFLWLPDWPIVALFFLLPDLRSITVHCISCLSKGGYSQHQRRRKRNNRISSIFYCIKSPRGKSCQFLNSTSCGFLLLGSHRCGSVVRRQTIVWDD